MSCTAFHATDIRVNLLLRASSSSQKKEQELSELRVIFWMMPGDFKSKPKDQYQIVFEEQFAYLSSPMTPM